MSRINHITQEQFEREVVGSDQPVLVDFWAPWCAPCRSMAPVLEELAQEYEGKLEVAKINVDEEPRLAEQFGISSIPTLVVFRGGKEFKRSVGTQRRQSLEEFINEIVNQKTEHGNE